MCVFVSNKHMYVQFVDDEAAATLASASTAQAGEGARISVETARQLGKRAADAARAKGIETVVFDRGGFRFAGRIRALADAAREAGLTF
jgi:large subunit ribosomal protein L18